MSILMMNICCSITAESATETVGAISEVLKSIDTFVNIIVSIVVIAGGILGFNYIRKLREKQVDSTFSYLTRLSIRLKYFRELLVTYKDEIMDRFSPEDCRREISADRIGFVTDAIKYLSENAKETLKFLRDEDNQIPAQKGWINRFNLFVEFLIDCEQLDQVTYFKWIDRDNLEEKKNQYYDKILNNIDELLKMVYNRQIELESEIFDKN